MVRVFDDEVPRRSGIGEEFEDLRIGHGERKVGQRRADGKREGASGALKLVRRKNAGRPTLKSQSFRNRASITLYIWTIPNPFPAGLRPRHQPRPLQRGPRLSKWIGLVQRTSYTSTRTTPLRESAPAT
jgi:hypothetical protein